ncbi:hypothetical protein EON80_06050 [bacterium]|nr:MAG: hypothetical protein EON80_06050 [bacterium]
MATLSLKSRFTFPAALALTLAILAPARAQAEPPATFEAAVEKLDALFGQYVRKDSSQNPNPNPLTRATSGWTAKSGGGSMLILSWYHSYESKGTNARSSYQSGEYFLPLDKVKILMMQKPKTGVRSPTMDLMIGAGGLAAVKTHFVNKYVPQTEGAKDSEGEDYVDAVGVSIPADEHPDEVLQALLDAIELGNNGG